MRLLPREEKFYHLFLKQVEIISEASRLLLEGVRGTNARMAGAATEINVLEHRGDEVIHELFTGSTRRSSHPSIRRTSTIYRRHWTTCSTAWKTRRTAW